MKDFLKEGDVIYLDRGMSVYAMIPEKFLFQNTGASKNMTQIEIELGQVLKAQADFNKVKEYLIRGIQTCFFEELRLHVEDSRLEKFVNQFVDPYNTQEVFDTNVFIGKYIVVKTTSTGGDTRTRYDGLSKIQPHGHKVFCKKLKENGEYNSNGLNVEFYQSGSFSVVIPPSDIQLVERTN